MREATQKTSIGRRRPMQRTVTCTNIYNAQSCERQASADVDRCTATNSEYTIMVHSDFIDVHRSTSIVDRCTAMKSIMVHSDFIDVHRKFRLSAIMVHSDFIDVHRKFRLSAIMVHSDFIRCASVDVHQQTSTDAQR